MRFEPTIFRPPAEKFQRLMDDEAAWADEHHRKVRFDGQYRAVCSCGWMGDRHAVRGSAEADLTGHAA